MRDEVTHRSLVVAPAALVTTATTTPTTAITTTAVAPHAPERTTSTKGPVPVRYILFIYNI
jgi:hypothetical protein